jgi:hypothetical protein
MRSDISPSIFTSILDGEIWHLLCAQFIEKSPVNGIFPSKCISDVKLLLYLSFPDIGLSLVCYI